MNSKIITTPADETLFVFDEANKVGSPIISKAAARYAAEIRAENKERTKYVAQAMTWLSQRRWVDYPEAAATVTEDAVKWNEALQRAGGDKIAAIQLMRAVQPAQEGA